MIFILGRRCFALIIPHQQVIIFLSEIAPLLNVGLRILVPMKQTKHASASKFRAELFLAAVLVYMVVLAVYLSG